jgi:hypothetical protein
MKYVVEIKEIDKQPAEWSTRTSWPEAGFYMVKGEDFSLYYVYEHGVQYISYPRSFLNTPFKEQGESVSESLLLKAIAAASRAEVLK